MTGYQSRMLSLFILSISILAYVFQNRTVCSIVWGICPVLSTCAYNLKDLLPSSFPPHKRDVVTQKNTILLAYGAISSQK